MSPAIFMITGVIVALVLSLLMAWLAAGWMLKRRSPDPTRTPADLGLNYEAVTFPARDGMKLSGRLTGQGDRPAIVFCAGMFGSMDGDTDLVPMFASEGFDVLQFDWRAHGASEGQHSTLGLRETLDVQGALDYLERRGVRRVGLMGFSFGGSVALRTTALDRRVLCMACDGGFVYLDRAMEALIAEKLGAAGLLLLRPLIPLIFWLLGLRLGETLRHAEPLESVGRIAPRPVLFIHGENDLIVPPEDQDAIFAACRDPKSLWRVSGAGHRQAQYRQPEEYRRHVIEFFKENLIFDI